ncbi:hypothetical protein G6355_11925 [Vibrio cholerae]|uniref:hypothetical protein n=1 Tax=Vibrio cholerae TaxID=666 RepID=UPI002F2DFF1B|nr:hypothetical protein [Vibrio cholerae O1]
MDSQTIIQKLKEGWSLSNRNCGWFLAEPQKPYVRGESIRIDDEIVNEMERQKLITIELPYNTLHAKLIEANDEVANESTD